MEKICKPGSYTQLFRRCCTKKYIRTKVIVFYLCICVFMTNMSFVVKLKTLSFEKKKSAFVGKYKNVKCNNQ